MRPILSAVFLLVATATLADLVKVSEATDTVYYLDQASISDKGKFRRVSVIQDYAKQEPSGVRSRRVLYEIDCTEERLRSIAGMEYSDSMAQGNSVNSREREAEWPDVVASTGRRMA